MNLLEKQVNEIKRIYKEVEKAGYKIKPIIIGKFALTVYTQGMYPANIISLLFPDINIMYKILREIGYENIGDFWSKGDLTVEVSKKFELIPTGSFNQIEVDGYIINVISLEDLLIDMMNECVAGDEVVCDLIKTLIKSYKNTINFHKIYQNLKNKQAVKKFREYQIKA